MHIIQVPNMKLGNNLTCPLLVSFIFVHTGSGLIISPTGHGLIWLPSCNMLIYKTLHTTAVLYLPIRRRGRWRRVAVPCNNDCNLKIPTLDQVAVRLLDIILLTCMRPRVCVCVCVWIYYSALPVIIRIIRRRRRR